MRKIIDVKYNFDLNVCLYTQISQNQNGRVNILYSFNCS